MAAILCTFAVAAFLAAAGLYAHYRLERRVVRYFARAVTSNLSSENTINIVLQLASHVHFHVPRQPDDPAFLFQFLGPLGATPGTVLEVGGCCSGLARLLIVALDALGIPAAQVTLNHRSLRYRHCLVEARVGSGQALLVDPKYGMFYRDEAGRLIGLDDLRAGVEPHFIPIPGRKRSNYPANDIHDWNFRRTGTANWVKSSTRRFAYSLLHAITRGNIDVWRQPVPLEWPQLLLCGGCMILGCCAILLALVNAARVM